MQKIMLFFSLCMLMSSVMAKNCEDMLGEWQGYWEDEKHVLLEATLHINQATSSAFIGEFFLSNGSKGGLHGKCQTINENEIYITLRQDAPLYNPCRGTLLISNGKALVHFFCFEPNQSGYFVKLI